MTGICVAMWLRNRHFRLIWSSKAAVGNPLVPTGRYSVSGVKPTPEQVFLASMICNVDKAARLLTVGEAAMDEVGWHPGPHLLSLFSEHAPAVQVERSEMHCRGPFPVMF